MYKVQVICVYCKYNTLGPSQRARLIIFYTNILPQSQGSEDEANWSLDIRSRRQLGG